MVADVNFAGSGPLTATGKVDKTGDGTNEDVKILRDAILKFKNFSGAMVYTPRGHVQTWRGFWGWLGGLRLVLPTVGYEMDTAGIEWP
jgi:hypothetical protein